MTELDVDLSDIPLRIREGFEAGYVNVRVFVAAVSEAQYTIEGLALEGVRRHSVTKKPEYRYVNIDYADPLYAVLHGSVMRFGKSQMELAIHDKLYDLRADRVRDRVEREIA